MKITLIVAGKTRESYLKEGIAEYVKRIKRYVPFSILTLQDIKSGKKSNPEVIKKQEGKQFLARITSTDFVVLMDERGSSLTSEGFAKYVSGMEIRTGHMVFFIGGAYGFSDDVYARANDNISLSSMTFSHQMVRLIFTEQLYRAFTIIKGEPYHHR